MKMNVSETFASYQGTGSLAGQKQFFVRTQGCSITCPIRHICDEPHALDPNSDFAQQIETRDIVKMAIDSVGHRGWIHITGGEPLDNLEAWKHLVSESQIAGLRVHTQTSGMIDHEMPIGRCGKVTVSPKGISENLKLKHGSELVLVAAPWVNAEIAMKFPLETSFEHYYIAPVHLGGGKWSNDKAVDLVERLSAKGQTQWRLTHQLHKIFGIR